MGLVIVYVAAINVISFFMMYADKKKAIKQKHRISEKMLWTAAFTGGTVGSLAGMWLFRHKTRKPSFKYGMPLLLTGQLMLVIFAFSS